MTDPTTELLNFRDLGGLRTTDGRVLTHGLLFRSDDLGILPQPVWSELQRRHHITTAIDFRSEFEDDQVGGLTDGGQVAVHHLPILDGSMMEMAHTNELTLGGMYDAIAFESGPELARAVTILARPGALPGIVFCTAGKDRTGILVALLLAAIGIERDDIVGDFVRSAAVGPAVIERFSRRFGPDDLPQIPEGMLDAPPEAIVSILDAVDGRFGSATEYFVHHGVDGAALDRLRRVLLR